MIRKSRINESAFAILGTGEMEEQLEQEEIERLRSIITCRVAHLNGRHDLVQRLASIGIARTSSGDALEVSTGSASYGRETWVSPIRVGVAKCARAGMQRQPIPTARSKTGRSLR